MVWAKVRPICFETPDRKLSGVFLPGPLMNRRIQTLLLSAVAASLALPGFAEETEIPDISIEALSEKIEKENVILVDVNGSRYFAKGHIPGAIDYHVHKENLAEVLGSDLETLVVVYCGGPYCSAYENPAREIQELGFTNVQHLSVGISGWIGAGKPTGRTDQ